MLALFEAVIAAPTPGAALVSIVVVTLLIRWKSKGTSSSRSLPLPPGPKRLPILGNLLQLPQIRPWEEYQKMSQIYGDIMYLEALGQPIVLLNSLSRATEIYEKRAVTFSDRPYLPVLDMMEMNWSFGLMQYGPEWRKHRRPFHQLVNGSALPKSYPIFNEEVLVLLRKLRDTPKDFKGHIQHFFGAIIMRMSYGFDDTEKNKELIHDAEILMSAFADAALPGRYLVNNLPFLKYVPSWFPGAGWKRFCKYVATVNQKVLYDSFEDVKRDLSKGIRSSYPSMATTLLDEMPEEDVPERRELESIARISCASGYAAGADTTVSSASGLLLTLAMHPDIQKRAQHEVDSVTGGKRLPVMSDRDSLPFVNALVKELGRWYTVVPLGLAHVAAEDAEYNGYFIPKGTFVMTNSWSILHDPEVYENPRDFNPDRFLKDGQLDPSVPDPSTSGTFGYGRRVCPGRALSGETLFLMAASILATFDVLPPKDGKTGLPVQLKLETLNSVIASPLPFEGSHTMENTAIAQPIAVDNEHGGNEVFRFSGDILIQIMRYVDPFDILSLRKTCRFISGITHTRIVWLNALEAIFNQQSNFTPNLPVEKMSILELEHAVTSPRRFLNLVKGLDVDEVPLPYSHRQLFFRRPPPLTGTYTVDGVFLIPGGRFMISVSGETLNIWDIGYNMGIPPSPYPLATADNCGRLYALCRTSDGKGILLATKKLTSLVNIYEIKLDGGVGKPCQFAFQAQLDMGAPTDTGFTVRLSPSVALIRFQSHIVVWDWTENMGCRWLTPTIDNPNRPIHSFDRTALTCCPEGNIYSWDIPKLAHLPSSDFDSIPMVENEPKFSIPSTGSPTAMVHFRVSGPHRTGPSASQPFLVLYHDPFSDITPLSLYSILDSGHRRHPLIPEELVIPTGTSPHVYGDRSDQFRGPLSAVLHCDGSLVFCSSSDSRALVITAIPNPKKAFVGALNPVSRYLTAREALPTGLVLLAFCPLSGRVVYSGADGSVYLRDFLLLPAQ